MINWEEINKIENALRSIEGTNWTADVDYYDDGTPYMTIIGTECVEFAENAPEWLQFLIKQLAQADEEIERLRYNLSLALDLTEIIKNDRNKYQIRYDTMKILYEDMRKEYLKVQEENGKLREEMKENEQSVNMAKGWLKDQLQSAQQENSNLRVERDDLIEGLLVYAEQRIGSDDDGEHAREILKEIGVSADE